MSQTKLDRVNVHRRDFRQHKAAPQINLLDDDTVPRDDIHAAFPFLEQISVTAKKHPYLTLAGIVALVGTVLSAIVGACVILFSSFFTMYGEMRETRAELKSLRSDIAIYVSEAKVSRTYSASVLARQNFIAGLMSKEAQQRLAEYDRVNPVSPPQVRELPPPPNPDN